MAARGAWQPLAVFKWDAGGSMPRASMVAPTHVHESTPETRSERASHASTARRGGARLFGQFLVDEGVIAASDLREALVLMRAMNSTIGELAVARGLVTAEQAEQIHQMQRHVDGRWGEIAVALGIGRATATRIEELVWEQSVANLRLSDALVELGILSATEIDTQLAAFETATRTQIEARVGDDEPLIEALTEGLPRLCQRVLATAGSLGRPRPWLGETHDEAMSVAIGGAIPCTLALACDRAVGLTMAEALDTLSVVRRERARAGLGAFISLYAAQAARRLDGLAHADHVAREPVPGAPPAGAIAVDLALGSGRAVVVLELPSAMRG